MRRGWSLAAVIGLGVAVTLSTALQSMQGQASQQVWRPYVLVGAVMTGVVSAWQLVAAAALARSAPPAEQKLMAGDPRRVGPYRILGRLGAGAMGRAYLGLTSSGQYVSVKIIRPEYSDSPEFRHRFAREITSIQRVNSPYTSQLLDADLKADQPWMATAYVAGPSLQQAVDTHGAWHDDEVWHLAGGIAAALDAIHAAGVVHRDLKPANILLTRDGPRVIDFGIARAADASTLTATVNRPGTPAYMAPEQALGREVGPAADVFALGVVLAFAATGRTPFGEGSSDVVLFRVVHQPPDLSGIGGDLRTLIEQCLDKDPARRPTPRQMVARSGARVPAGPRQPTLALPALPMGAVAPRRRRLVGVTAALALVVALASVVLQLNPHLAWSDRDSGASPTSGPPTSASPATASPTPSTPTPSVTQAATPSATLLGSVHLTSEAWAVAFSPDGKTVATGADDGAIQLWNVTTRQQIGAAITANPGRVDGLEFSPDGTMLASISGGTLLLFGVATHGQLGSPITQAGGFHAVRFSPNGTMLATAGVGPNGGGGGGGGGGETNAIKLWSTSTHAQIGTALVGHTDWVWDVAFSPDGSMLASASYDRTVRLWSVSSHQQLAVLTGHTDKVYTVAFSPDGKTLASGGQDATARLWRVADRVRLATLTGHRYWVARVAFNPDGSLLATTSFDGKVLTWNVTSHKQVAQLLASGVSANTEAAFSADWQTFAGNGQGPPGDRVYLYRVST